MLYSLHVKNFAIIDEAYVEFGPGMNILTGETGAGKSILLGSLNAALGSRVSREMLGRNADYAQVTLEFDGDNESVRELLMEQEIPEEECLTVSRRITDTGRSVCKVNGEPVNALFLKELAARLFEVYGQRENQSLLEPKNQLKLVDRYAREKSEPLLDKIRSGYEAYRSLVSEYEEAKTHADSRTRELSFLQFEHGEIEKAAIKPGEDSALEERYRVLLNRSRILEATGEADRLLLSDSQSASELVGRTLRQLSKAVSYDGALGEIYGQIEQLEELLREIGIRLSDYTDGLETDPSELAETEERLNLINRLKSKYGKTVAEIEEYDRNLILKIEKLTDFDSYLCKLSEEVSKKEKELSLLCSELGALRRKSAEELQVRIKDALSDLNFNEVRFRIAVETVPMSAGGTETAEFLISVNPGEPEKPLSKIASGGELSRISLAVKSVLAGKDEIETLILDEIDTGVSGRTAQKVAEKMAAIAEDHQIICITHLPQIAAMADRHFLIEKQTDGETTQTKVLPLKEEQTVNELARMLGGVRITESVMENAREMRMLAKKETL